MSGLAYLSIMINKNTEIMEATKNYSEMLDSLKNDIKRYCQFTLLKVDLIEKGFSRDQVSEILLSLHQSGQPQKDDMTGTEAALARKMFLAYTDEFTTEEVKQIGVAGGLWSKDHRDLKGLLYRTLVAALESNVKITFSSEDIEIL